MELETTVSLPNVQDREFANSQNFFSCHIIIKMFPFDQYPKLFPGCTEHFVLFCPATRQE